MRKRMISVMGKLLPERSEFFSHKGTKGLLFFTVAAKAFISHKGTKFLLTFITGLAAFFRSLLYFIIKDTKGNPADFGRTKIYGPVAGMGFRNEFGMTVLKGVVSHKGTKKLLLLFVQTAAFFRSLFYFIIKGTKGNPADFGRTKIYGPGAGMGFRKLWTDCHSLCLHAGLFKGFAMTGVKGVVSHKGTKKLLSFFVKTAAFFRSLFYFTIKGTKGNPADFGKPVIKQRDKAFISHKGTKGLLFQQKEGFRNEFGMTVLMILLSGTVTAQQIKPLSVGDTVPDIKLTNILNYPVSEIPLSSLKNKHIILDFWNTHCGSCIAALPRLDSLQKEFKEQLQIITVTDETAPAIHAFLQIHNEYAHSPLLFVTEDTLLHRLFPHKILSHEIWIGGNRTVKAITIPQYVNTQNIRSFLSGREAHWPVKNDLLEFNPRQRITAITKPVYYSALTPYINGVPGVYNGLKADSTAGIKRFYAVNNSILQLYWFTLHKEILPALPYHLLTVLEIKDSSFFLYRPQYGYRDVWNNKNEYCYESVLPINTAEENILYKMRQDLNAFFSLNGRIEIRNMDCLQIKQSGTKKIATTAYKSKAIKLSPSDEIKFMHKGTVTDLVHAFNQWPGMLPVFDETGFTGYTDIELGNLDVSDTASLQKILQQQGFEIFPCRRKLNMLVITEPGYATSNHTILN